MDIRARRMHIVFKDSEEPNRLQTKLEALDYENIQEAFIETSGGILTITVPEKEKGLYDKILEFVREETD